MADSAGRDGPGHIPRDRDNDWTAEQRADLNTYDQGDLESARGWWERAAFLGDESSMRCFGNLLRDSGPSQAGEWYRRWIIVALTPVVRGRSPEPLRLHDRRRAGKDAGAVSYTHLTLTTNR